MDKTREKIRRIYSYNIYARENKKGKPVNGRGKEILVPSFVQIRNNVFEQINSLGFSIERVRAAEQADCIVRVFQKRHYKHGDYVFNVYGADCFTQESGKWLAAGRKHFELDDSKCIVEQCLRQGECASFECEYLDFYLKIS